MTLSQNLLPLLLVSAVQTACIDDSATPSLDPDYIDASVVDAELPPVPDEAACERSAVANDGSGIAGFRGAASAAYSLRDIMNSDLCEAEEGFSEGVCEFSTASLNCTAAINDFTSFDDTVPLGQGSLKCVDGDNNVVCGINVDLIGSESDNLTVTVTNVNNACGELFGGNVDNLVFGSRNLSDPLEEGALVCGVDVSDGDRPRVRLNFPDAETCAGLRMCVQSMLIAALDPEEN